MTNKIKLGISACLLGEKVRYDGGHKRNRYIIQTLGKRFTWVPVCPEVEAGLSIPREPMRLEGDRSCPRLVVIGSGIDLTYVLNVWAAKKVKKLDKEGLCGFILKSRSPSCAIDDAEIIFLRGAEGAWKRAHFQDSAYSARDAFDPALSALGKKKGKTAGLFSSMVMEHDPILPLIDEEDMADPILRENFIERAFAYKRWLDFMKKKPSLGHLVSFHSELKFQLMAHSPRHYSAAERHVAGAKGRPIREVYQQYIVMLMEGLRLIATPKKNADVLMHIMGHFKTLLTRVEKQKLLKVIEQYRQGQVPLIAPLTLLRRYVRKLDKQYLRRQTYLNLAHYL